ncbi:MAG TPA: DUF433 domain-containing protein [Isosphaeraceae bacterium]|jgi:uncharacterized protein (DUF433 family)|nr:DUF433 domain-containing protein [Isosphaeraceae bacterium]
MAQPMVACPCPVESGPTAIEPFAAALRRELAPRGALEGFFVEQMIRSARRLEAAASAEPADAREGRLLRARADLARALLLAALDTFDLLRARPSAVVAVASEGPPDAAVPVATQVESAPPWRDRLAFDPEVSDTSPVVRGTWVSVAHVVSLIVDGWSWADILRDHPELTDDDIRACLAYTVEDEV